MKKRRQFACHSCYKITSTTNENVFLRKLCFECRSFREYENIVKEMIPK